MKKISQFVHMICISFVSVFFFGCGTTRDVTHDMNKSNQNKYTKDGETAVSNGFQALSLTPDTNIAIFSFNIPAKGQVSLDVDNYCDLKLINDYGKVLNSVSFGAINPELEKGKYYITIESKSSSCKSFNLFSPKIIDKYTNKNEKIITNGQYLISGKINIVSFNMPEKGHVSLDVDNYCDLKLINDYGKVLNSVSFGAINPELEKGKYYITIESKSSSCKSFNLFSPKIVDKYTDGSQGDIANGHSDI